MTQPFHDLKNKDLKFYSHSLSFAWGNKKNIATAVFYVQNMVKNSLLKHVESKGKKSVHTSQIVVALQAIKPQFFVALGSF